jgi:hypothetical protein
MDDDAVQAPYWVVCTGVKEQSVLVRIVCTGESGVVRGREGDKAELTSAFAREPGRA